MSGQSSIIPWFLSFWAWLLRLVCNGKRRPGVFGIEDDSVMGNYTIPDRQDPTEPHGVDRRYLFGLFAGVPLVPFLVKPAVASGSIDTSWGWGGSLADPLPHFTTGEVIGIPEAIWPPKEFQIRLDAWFDTYWSDDEVVSMFMRQFARRGRTVKYEIRRTGGGVMSMDWPPGRISNGRPSG